MDEQSCYDAYAARDRRFDGVFFVGVTSTGIYCRPVCTAKTPKAANCRFFPSAAAAERAAFRPCLRCRPELAPGRAPVDGARRIAERVADRIAEGLLDSGGGLEQIAEEFHFSPRQIRRIVRRELGASPIELVQTRRLLLARQLLSETALSVTSIAYASGFSSLRRFNDAFLRHYSMAPSRLRAGRAACAHDSDAISLRLDYRPPYDWRGILDFLSRRALTGVEYVDGTTYSRTLRIGDANGVITVRQAATHDALSVTLTAGLVRVLPAVLTRVRAMFDLDARPDLIAAHLAQDDLLKDAVQRNPGLRVAGAFDGFELGVRAILGQQVTVRAAATLAGRFTIAFGEAMTTSHTELTHLAPAPQRIAQLDVEDIASLGIIRTRAQSIIALAGEVASGRLQLHGGRDPAEAMRELVAIPGIGPWTASYIAMRALRWPDAFPREDIVLRNRLGRVSGVQAEKRSQPWSPWRSYATLHLWRM